MTDNEIIKALDCCVKNDVAQCTICPYYDMLHGCRRAMEKEVLGLINRQKAEIERLKHHCFGIQNELEAYKDTFNTATDEAIKEFAARLKEKADRGYWQEHFYVDIEEIDNLVKEMTESEGKDNA